MSAYSYTKLFSSITESTVWCEPAGTRLVWITLLAKCDRHGRFSGALPGLARLANVTLQEAEIAISTLSSPDPYSRTPDYEGRRIEAIDGGWRLLNHQKYRDMRDEEVRREQNREAQRRRRASLSAVSKTADSQQGVSDQPPMSAHADAYADADSKKKSESTRAPSGTRLPPDWQPSDEDRKFAATERPDLSIDTEAAKFRDYFHGAAGAKGRKADWPATWRNWVRRAEAPKGGTTASTGSAPAAPAPDWRKPSETPLQRELAHIRHQHSLGAYGEGPDADAERDRLIADARRRHAANGDAT